MTDNIPTLFDVHLNPKIFKILNEKLYKGYLILLLKYPHSEEFDGKKLLVYQGFTSSKELMAFTGGVIDPRFSNDKVSPIAMFKPRQTSAKLIEAMIDAITI